MNEVKDILTGIKDYALSKYDFFNDGFANVSKPDGKEVVIDQANKEYRGIADNMGRYFYLRSLKNTTYSRPSKPGRVQYYQAVTPCRIVAVMPGKADAEILLQCLINSINSYETSTITKSCTEPTQVFTEETGNKEAAVDNLVLVSVDFDVHFTRNTKNCELNPCDC